MMSNFPTHLFRWVQTSRWAPWAVYSMLALLIMLPLLMPGYILTLDLVFTPTIPWPQDVTNTYPLNALLFLLGLFLPGDIVEKIVLFSTFVLAGVGMHLLVQTVRPSSRAVKSWIVPSYVAGIFYIINPFVYDRVMAGHLMFLLGYALVPFFVRSLFHLLASPSLKSGVLTGLWAFLVVTASIHHAGMLAVIGLLFTVLALGKRQTRTKRVLLSTAAAMGVFTLLSSFWLVPCLVGSSPITQSTAGFDGAHFAAFATDGSGAVGQLANVIRLQGFWVEAQQLFILPQAITPVWGLLFVTVWVVVIVGGARAWRQHRKVAYLALGCIAIGVIVSATQAIETASHFVPLLAGYREPQKFAGFVAFGYAILIAFGSAHFIANAKHKVTARTTTIVLLLLPLIITPTLLWGCVGQLIPRSYPAEWHQADRELQNRTSASDKILFLPWHQYASYSFSERIIANPAAKFFHRPMVIGDDPEFGSISPTVPDSDKQHISSLLKKPGHLTAANLSDFNIRYVLLANEQDASRYAWLDTQLGIKQVYKNTKITLYHVEDHS